MFPLAMENLMAGCFNPAVDFLSCASGAGSFLNRKDFEEMFWPTFKILANTAAQYGKKSILWFEGNWTRYYDVLADLPPHNCIIWSDTEDLTEAKKQWGNKITIASNMSVNYLGTRSKAECVGMAEKLLDTYARDGAFIFAFDRLMMSRNDCNMENLKAVLKTVKNFQVN
jgi:uroporphyrinogen-III decarboxylase